MFGGTVTVDAPLVFIGYGIVDRQLASTHSAAST